MGFRRAMSRFLVSQSISVPIVWLSNYLQQTSPFPLLY